MMQKKPEKKLLPKGLSIVLNTIFYSFIIILVTFSVFFSFSNSDSHSFLGFRFYNVISYSMQGMIPKGSLIIVKETSADNLKKEDVITFNTDDKGSDRVTHQIVDILKGPSGIEGFVTRGYANNANDANPIAPDKVLGKVVFHIPVIGDIFLYLRQHFVWVIIVGVVIIASAIVLYLFIKKKGANKKTMHMNDKVSLNENIQASGEQIALFDDISYNGQLQDDLSGCFDDIEFLGDTSIPPLNESEMIKDPPATHFIIPDPSPVSQPIAPIKTAEEKRMPFQNNTPINEAHNNEPANINDYTQQLSTNVNQRVDSIVKELQDLFLKDAKRDCMDRISAYNRKSEQAFTEIQAILMKISREQDDLMKELKNIFDKL